MSYPVHYVPAGDVLPIFFDTYAGATGASVTMSGLAVTDIEIYKDGSVTQRASDAGYTLLDTDGIDFDGTTGIHGFSIDTGDNTDAGFYTVGAWFHVVVSAVTVDTQTVNFTAAAFRLMPAEGLAAHPKVDVGGWLGTAPATPTTNGVPEVDLTHVGGSAVSTSTAQIGVNVIQAAGTAWGSGAITAASIASDAIAAAKIATGAITAAKFAAGAIDAAAIASDAITAAKIADGAIDAATFAAGAITATVIATGAIDADAVAADAVAEIADGVWDEARAGHVSAGTFGEYVLADVVKISDDATAANNCELMFDGTGYAGGTAKLGVDTVAISGDTTAADNAELAFDGNGYGFTACTIPTVTTLTNKSGFTFLGQRRAYQCGRCLAQAGHVGRLR
jgi:hypothetical protein